MLALAALSLAVLPLTVLSSCAAPRVQEPAPQLPPLRSELEALAAKVRGAVGIYVKHLRTGEEIAIRADELFPTASLVKVPILLGLFEKLEQGELRWDQKLRYTNERAYPGEDLVESLRDGEEVSLAKLVTLMIAFSDNTASLWLQELAGTGKAINAYLAARGFEQTRVNSRTEGRAEAQKSWGWGQTTPREMAELLRRIHASELHSRAACTAMLRALARSVWDGEALSQLPPHVVAFTKQGAVNRSRSELVLVEGRNGPFVFCVITKNQEDQSWTRANEGYVLLRAVTRLLYERYEPQDAWRPAEGHERYEGS
ncbi:MAG: serine hydrolase [Planctomycetes bacterium]|nr:serine hydrolase [Planctomycetota bacterium]